MKSIHRSILVAGLSSFLVWSGMAGAAPLGHQHGQQGQQGQQVQQKRVAFVLAYMRWKKGEALTVRDLVKAKLVTEKVKTFVEDLKQRFEESDADIQALADRLQIKIEEYKASTADEQDEVQADTTMLEKLKTIAADRAGEQEFLVAVRDWADSMLERIDTLRSKIEGTEATPVLDKFQARIEGLRARIDELIEH